MALNHAECEEMIAACQEADVPLFVASYRRALPRFLKIKALLDSGAIGEIRFVSVILYQPILDDERNPETLPWRVLPEIAGGGRFVDLAAHQLDFLDYALGPISRVQGVAGNQAGLFPAEDIVTGEDGSIEVTTTPEAFSAVLAAMDAAGLTPANAEVTMRASVEVELDVETGRKVLKFLDILEDLDDTQAVYSNADIPEEAYA
jgi:predicted dehydrogenase